MTTFTALAPGAMCTQVQPENSRVAAITDDNGNRRMDNSGGGNENARDCGPVRVNRAKRLTIRLHPSPRERWTSAAYFAATGLPSASTTLTSPRFSARTGCSIFDRSPTTTQVSAFGSIALAASATCAGVSALISVARRVT